MCRHSDALCKEMEGFDVQSLDEVSAYKVMNLKMLIAGMFFTYVECICFYVYANHLTLHITIYLY